MSALPLLTIIVVVFLASAYVCFATCPSRITTPPFDPRKVAVRRREPVTAGGAVTEDDAWVAEVNAILGDFS